MVVSNTHCPEVGELYAGAARLVVERAMAIGNGAGDPARNTEYLIMLDPRGAGGAALLESGKYSRRWSPLAPNRSGAV